MDRNRLLKSTSKKGTGSDSGMGPITPSSLPVTPASPQCGPKPHILPALSGRDVGLAVAADALGEGEDEVDAVWHAGEGDGGSAEGESILPLVLHVRVMEPSGIAPADVYASPT